MNSRPWLLILAFFLSVGPWAKAQQPPSFVKQVRPLLAKYCIECHNAQKLKGGLDVVSYKALLQGGNSAPGFVAGKPDESLLVVLTEGQRKPSMPPKKSRQPTPAEIKVLRAWVAAGAKDDTGKTKASLPEIRPGQPAAAPVAALAYRPDGKLLAAGAYQDVIWVDPATAAVVGKVAGQNGPVTALAFSGDGQRLAVASGDSGQPGEIRLFAGDPSATKPVQAWTAHTDAVYGLSFSPDGKVLATCGYDRLVRLWDTTSGKEVRTLRDHSDAVYAVAFSPDGKLLASAAADRAVKVWDVATGTRLYTLGDPTDWVYTLAWSPAGRHLAAAGVDKSIRIWQADVTGGKLVHAVFAHDGPVVRIAYAPDGKSLYSVGEDRALKAWDTATMTELRAYPNQPEAPLSLAVRPDRKQIALGRFDGALVLLNEQTGKVEGEPLPVKPQVPVLKKATPAAAVRGQKAIITLEGDLLDQDLEGVANSPDLTIHVLDQARSPKSVSIQVETGKQTLPGIYQISLKSSAGVSATLPFAIDLKEPTPEQEPSDSPTTGPIIALPATVIGALGRPGDQDYYRFTAQAGQEVGIQVVTAAAKLEPVLVVTDTTGRVLAESGRGALGFKAPVVGIYAVGFRDREFRGGPDFDYRLNLGDLPVVAAVFPLGLQRGTEAAFHIAGVNLGAMQTVRFRAPETAAVGTMLPLPLASAMGKPLGMPSVTVGEFPEIVEGLLPVPGTANGRIEQPGATGAWRFSAKKGRQVIIEVHARRLGSPLDSTLEILDEQGKPVPRATLRCLSKTNVTFRDHDSAVANIRIDAWNELAINDFIWVGNELLRIRQLPLHPDADCTFVSVNGLRVGHLDTTPTHLSLGTPMYKVAIHPPGTAFPPNGLPVIPLTYRNDDGGPGYGKDSRLAFDPPANGTYQVRVADARGQGGRDYAYRLTVRPPRPSFDIRLTPATPTVFKGGAVPMTVTADRIDGFDGPIDVKLTDLPPGFSAPATSIPAGETTTAFALWVDANASPPPANERLKLAASATIEGQSATREAAIAMPKLAEAGDIVTTAGQLEVAVKPGQSVWLTVTIERRNDFKGRVPLEVRGLPHGVRVLNIGLNGVLITEKEMSRAIEIYCEPWVKATSHPIVVLARREGKNTEHAARSVTLHVVK